MKRQNPAEGERRAVRGYHAQYRKVASSLLFHALRGGDLQWIRLADPDGGRVDDFQIGRASRIDAFQVKWSQYGGNFTFSNLVTGGDQKPSLIAQLADGWQRLRAAHPGQRVVVHLVTNEMPSTSDSPPVSDPVHSPKHFAAFIAQAWKPSRVAGNDSSWSVPIAWTQAWDTIQLASSLSVEEFTIFVQDCELDFGFRPLEPTQDGSRDDARLQEDAEHVAQVLFATVADQSTVIELSRDQLLVRLGWQSRFEFRSRHEFPVDESLYQPNQAVAEHLAQSLAALRGGYIAVLGTPGSGKSTLLTQMLLARPERVLRYYAYVPDAQDAMPLRGEAANFVHDMVLALERAGFRERSGFGPTDRESLLQCFHRQLQRLHDDWAATGRKTILLIDGLDHIDREQHPSRSLLVDLPLPDQVPEGVFIILGSQTDAPLPPRIQTAVRQPQRRIEMQPLSREAVLRLLSLSPLAAALTTEQRQQIFRLSAGRPLALIYLLQRIGELSDSDTLQIVLDSAEQFGGNIEEQYHGYWRQIESDAALLHLLGLLARLRGAIDLDWIDTWADHDRKILRGYVAHRSLQPMLATVTSVFRRAPLSTLRIATSTKARFSRVDRGCHRTRHRLKSV